MPTATANPPQTAAPLRRFCRICGQHETPQNALHIGQFVNDADKRIFGLLCNGCNL